MPYTSPIRTGLAEEHPKQALTSYNQPGRPDARHLEETSGTTDRIHNTAASTCQLNADQNAYTRGPEPAADVMGA